MTQLSDHPETRRIATYRDLAAWQHAFKLGMVVYRATAQFPESERFGLTSQLRRGAISIASNIAEGYGRGRRVDYVRFLKIARGALYEVDTQLLFASQLEYLSQARYEELKMILDESERVLAGLIRSLEKRARGSAP
jgi:four helix bundle protein